MLSSAMTEQELNKTAFEFIKDKSVFSSLSPQELTNIISLTSAVHFVPSENIPFKDKNSEHIFYLISSGHVKLAYQKHLQHPVRICGPGDIIGYGEWNFKSPHYAESLDELNAWRFHHHAFQSFLHTSPNLQEIMIRVLCNILALKDDRISALENYSVRNRVASVLLSLSDKFGKMTSEGLRIDVKIDRETLAKLAGTVTESLSRQLSELESEAIIQREGRFIYVKNRPSLVKRSQS